MRLSDAFPGPKVVRLAGEPYLARGLRLRDLAAFEHLAEASWPDPLDGLEGDAPDYRRRLRRAYDAAEAGPPAWGSRECTDAALATLPGQVALVRAVLRDHDLSLDDAASLVAAMSDADWGRLCRVAFGTDPAAEIEALIDAEIGVDLPPVPPSGVPWPVAVAEVCRALRKLPAELADMTLAEIAFVRSGGKAARREKGLPPGMPLEEFDRRAGRPRSEFWAEDRAEASRHAGL